MICHVRIIQNICQNPSLVSLVHISEYVCQTNLLFMIYDVYLYIYILYYIIKYKLYSQNVLLLNQLSAFRASPEAEHVLCIEQIICSVE